MHIFVVNIFCLGIQLFYSFFLYKFIEGILNVHARDVKIKKFLDSDVVTKHHLQKEFMEKYMCWYAHGEPFVPHNTMVERITDSTSSSSNVHEIVDDNSDPYKNMGMEAIKINQDHVGPYIIIDEEPNVDATNFFFLSFKRFG